MYTLLELESKTFGELKKIGHELDVLPEGDRRLRQSWIDAIAGVNPPLLQLLEVSPGVEVDLVQEPIIETVENAPGVEVDLVQEPIIETVENALGVEVDLVQEPIIETVENAPGVEVEQIQESIIETVENAPGVEAEHVQDLPLESKFGRIVYPQPAQGAIAQNEEARPQFDRIEGANVHNLGFHPAKSDADSSGARSEALGSQEGDRVLAEARDCETGRGRVLPDQSIKLVNQAQEPIAPVPEISPGVDLIDDELPECCNCFGDGYTEDEFGSIEFCKFCQCKTEPRLSHQKTQRAIGLAAKISLDPKSDRNPILTGIPLSDRFLARYSPPQSETLHYELTDGYRADTDGQLSLFEVQVVSEPEPPDPDDFESLDAFLEAIASWDLEHPSRFDNCSDYLPNSVHNEPNSVPCEPPDPEDFDSMFAFWAAYDAWDEASDNDSEPLEVSLESFCEWAPCPAHWYEPVALDSSIKVLEMSPDSKSSITSEFFIPTFGSLGDRFKGRDEPPDTGIFARLPKPKPPTFPPQAASCKLDGSQPKSDHPETIPKLFRNYPKTIPKLFHRVAAGSSTQPARSPPGGDAMS